MALLHKDLSLVQREPSLWVKQLSLYEKEDKPPLRIITLRRGINVIWAHEPTGDNIPANGIEQAGHGVGKTSFCLLMRYCLADSSTAIDKLRNELATEFPQGGVAAVVSIMGEEWSVYRPYAKYHQSRAIHSGNEVSLFDKDDTQLEFKQYEEALSKKLLQHLQSPVIPETGQPIEWQHLLNWLTRDQSARFLHFYHWREGEGNNLRRPKLDPPVLLKLVLGLMTDNEIGLLDELKTVETALDKATNKQNELVKKPAYILAKVEQQLRSWGGYTSDQPLYSDDLLSEGVISSIHNKCEELSSENKKLEADTSKIDDAIDDLVVKAKVAKDTLVSWQLEMDSIKARIEGNLEEVKKIANKKENILALSGPCPVCRLPYKQCSHAKEESEKISISERRNQRNLTSLAADLAPKSTEIKHYLDQAEKNSTAANSLLAKKKGERLPVQTKITENTYKIRRSNELIQEYQQWEQRNNNIDNDQELLTVVNEIENSQEKVNKLKLKVVQVCQNKTNREKRLSELLDSMAKRLLGENAFGYFKGSNENDEFPFHLSVQGGEAYRVLSVLLGDFASLIFSLIEKTAFPSFLLHDCPREADMSEMLYQHVLTLLQEIEENYFPAGEASFQYIVTTTTPPPKSLTTKPYKILELKPDDEGSLLFGRRFNIVEQNAIDF